MILEKSKKLFLIEFENLFLITIVQNFLCLIKIIQKLFLNKFVAKINFQLKILL